LFTSIGYLNEATDLEDNWGNGRFCDDCFRRSSLLGAESSNATVCFGVCHNTADYTCDAHKKEVSRARAMPVTVEEEVVVLYAVHACGGKPSKGRATEFILSNQLMKERVGDYDTVSTVTCVCSNLLQKPLKRNRIGFCRHPSTQRQ
jgi:hypothetical protein